MRLTVDVEFMNNVEKVAVIKFWVMQKSKTNRCYVESTNTTAYNRLCSSALKRNKLCVEKGVPKPS